MREGAAVTIVLPFMQKFDSIGHTLMNAGEFLKTRSAQFRVRRSLSPLPATERADRRAALGITERTSVANEAVPEVGIKDVKGGLSIPYATTSVGTAVLRGAAMLVPGAEVSASRYRPLRLGSRSLTRVSVPSGSEGSISRYEAAKQVVEDVVDGVQRVGLLTRDRRTLNTAAGNVRYVRTWDDRRREEQRNGGQRR